MKIDRFLQLFVVKEKKFYPMYMEQADNTLHAARLLAEMLRDNNPEKQKEIYSRLKEYEHRGDELYKKIYEELNKTFVTPFDREDIDMLAASIEAFLNFIHDAGKRILMYCPVRIDGIPVKIGQNILKDAELVKEIMAELQVIQKKPVAIEQKAALIKEIEQEVDDLYETYMSELFANEKDAIELVKLKNIAESLEDATDRAKDIGDTIRGIIIKFA